MRFEIFMVRRYLKTRHKPFFISFLIFISLLGVATGVFFLIFVQAVMSGFENDFHQKVTGFKAPLVVMSKPDSGKGSEDPPAELIRQADARIVATEPFVEGEAVARAETGETVGVKVRGVVGKVGRQRFGKFYFTDNFSAKSIIVGEDLAGSLQINPDFFETVRLIFPLGEVGPTGELLPTVQSFTLTGVFRSGFYEYDTKYVLITYAKALQLFGGQARRGLEVWVEPESAVDAVKDILSKKLSSQDFELKTWREQNPKLFAALKLEKMGMFLLLFVLLLIASFNIFGLTSLVVLEKVRDMAILRSMGLTAARVKRIFRLQALAFGLSGMVLGGGLGLLVNFILEKYPLKLPPSYYLEYLPLRMEPGGVVFLLLLAPVIAWLASLYPSHRSTEYSPVEVLRYE